MATRLASTATRATATASTAASSSPNTTSDAAAHSSIGRAGALFFGSLCAGTFGLGTWQTLRYHEKQGLVAQRTSDLAQPPVPYHEYRAATNNHKRNTVVSNIENSASVVAPTPTTGTTTSPSYRLVTVTGRWDHAREFLVGPRGAPPGALPDAPGSSAAGLAASPQGYYVWTPLRIRTDSSGTNGRDSSETILVNRGWVPRQMVPQDRLQQRGSQQQQLLQWDRPPSSEVVQITCVPAAVEKPKFLVAEHNLQSHPPILYWYDWPTMRAVANLALSDDHREKNNNDSNDDEPRGLQLATQVVPPTLLGYDQNDDAATTDTPPSSSTALSTSSWPLAPAAESVGDFKVTPAVHVGYALTWYGLSAAGVVMLRKLLTKGR